MWHHEANEAHEAGQRHRSGGRERGEGDGDPPLTAHVDTKVQGTLVAQQEGGERSPARGEGDRGEEDRCGGSEHAWPTCAVETAKKKREDRSQVRTAREHRKRERSRQQRRNGVADQEHAGDSLVARANARDPPNERNGEERADERRELYAAELPGNATERQGDRQRRAECGAAARAEHVRIGERIAQQ